MRKTLLTVAVIGLITLATAPVHAAVTVSLGSAPTTSLTDVSGTLFSVTATQATGSGNFSPFMRIQREGNSQGYNSSLNNGPSATMDLINLPGNSSSTLVMDKVVTEQNHVFLSLDYNEQGKPGKSLLTLEDLVLVVSTDPDKTGPAGPGKKDPWSIQSIPLSTGDQVLYQMSASTLASGDRFVIELDANNNPAHGNGGSGSADLHVVVNLNTVQNIAAFKDPNHYLYVYSRFSGGGSGFEEWSSFQKILQTPIAGAIPEPASLGLLGAGVVALLMRRRRGEQVNR